MSSTKVCHLQKRRIHLNHCLDFVDHYMLYMINHRLVAVSTLLYLQLVPISSAYAAQGDSETSVIATLSKIEVGVVSKTCLYPVHEQGALASARGDDGVEFRFFVPKGASLAVQTYLANRAGFARRRGVDVTLGPPGTFRKIISRLSDCPERIELIFNSLIVTDDVGSKFREK